MSEPREHVTIIKSEGRRPSEHYSHVKLHDSIVAACLSAGTPEGQAESIANAVCDYVVDWLTTRPEVTSADLRRVAGRHLQVHHPSAAYLYEQHRTII